MRIAVIGAGAIGGLVAAYLTKAGADVVLIGRQDQVDAINARGLMIKGARGVETIKVAALVCLQQTCDLAIFAVKTQDIEEAFEANGAYLKDCLVLSTENGVQADHILARYFRPERQLSSIVMFGSTYTKPGEIIFNFEGDWIVGQAELSKVASLDSRFRGNDREIAAVLNKAFKVVLSPNIVGQKYLKLFVNLNNCIPALIGKSMQETFADMDFCRLSILLLKEGLDIVNAAQIKLVSLPDFPVERILGLAGMPIDQAAGIINKTLTGLSKEPLYGSILQSIMRGKTSEIDYINGEVVQIAGRMNLQAPLNTKIVAMVHEVERRGKFFSEEEVKKHTQHYFSVERR